MFSEQVICNFLKMVRCRPSRNARNIKIKSSEPSRNAICNFLSYDDATRNTPCNTQNDNKTQPYLIASKTAETKLCSRINTLRTIQ